MIMNNNLGSFYTDYNSWQQRLQMFTHKNQQTWHAFTIKSGSIFRLETQEVIELTTFPLIDVYGEIPLMECR